jgi:hypothetical protein
MVFFPLWQTATLPSDCAGFLTLTKAHPEKQTSAPKTIAILIKFIPASLCGYVLLQLTDNKEIPNGVGTLEVTTIQPIADSNYLRKRRIRFQRKASPWVSCTKKG